MGQELASLIFTGLFGREVYMGRAANKVLSVLPPTSPPNNFFAPFPQKRTVPLILNTKTSVSNS